MKGFPKTRMLTEPVLDRDYFESLKRKAFSSLKPGEHLFLGLAAECSQFIRINAAKVRQIGTVEDAQLDLTLVIETAPKELRKATGMITLKGVSYQDQEELMMMLARLREEARQLPPDPYALLPKDHGSSSTEKEASMLDIEDAPRTLLEPLADIDIAGIYAAGPVVRAMANSAGLTHWFATQAFSLDYSLYTTGQRAVKSTFAGRIWDSKEFAKSIEDSRRKLVMLEKPSRKVQPGSYRTYLEPSAVEDLAAMLSWGGVSEAAIQQGESPLRKLRTGEAAFSARFSLHEDFADVETPRFNDMGELAPEKLALIENGKLKNSLISSRTAKEYALIANGANGSETLRAPSIAGGTFSRADAAQKLGEGLYLSNLHYLNWSDQPGGRVTGMTRYACFWVEDGKIVAPIENLRFDDSLFSLFGDALIDLTRERAYSPTVQTYGRRELGGVWSPGMLVSEMKFTL